MSRSWRPPAALLLSLAGALTGHRLLLLAAPWLVVTTGSLTEAGTVALCHTLPYAIMQGLSGPLLDRIPPAWVAAGGAAVCFALDVGCLGSPRIWSGCSSAAPPA